MKIKFANGITIYYLSALEKEEYYNGSNRRTLTIACDKNAISIDELNRILSDENNTKCIVLEGEPYPIYKTKQVTTKGLDENGQEINVINEVTTNEIERYETSKNVYDDYKLKLKCGIESVFIESETSDTPAIYEDRLIFKLGKCTYVEEQLKRLGI